MFFLSSLLSGSSSAPNRPTAQKCPTGRLSSQLSQMERLTFLKLARPSILCPAGHQARPPSWLASEQRAGARKRNTEYGTAKTSQSGRPLPVAIELSFASCQMSWQLVGSLCGRQRTPVAAGRARRPSERVFLAARKVPHTCGLGNLLQDLHAAKARDRSSNWNTRRRGNLMRAEVVEQAKNETQQIVELETWGSLQLDGTE